MSYRIKIVHRDLPPGRVSLRAAAIVMNALRIAVRAEAAAIGSHKSLRGRLTKLQRESTAMSLVGVESGSGVLVIESESSTLLNIPGSAFDELIVAVSKTNGHPINSGMCRAVLALEPLFRRDSDVECVELLGEAGESGTVDAGTIARMKSVLSDEEHDPGTGTREITGRLLELDLARQSFRIHGPSDEIETIAYSELLEPIVMEALNCFVRATLVEADGQWELASLEALEGVPPMRFHERRSIDDIAREQGVSALEHFDTLGMPEGDGVPLDEFQSFIKALRRGGES
jgi:hypothetical protein